MKLKNIIELVLINSGEYNIPGKFVELHGFDAFGKPISEKVPALDNERLSRDLDDTLAGRKPSPVRAISGLSVLKEKR